MTADLAGLEERVSALEEEIRAGAARKLDALAYDLSVMRHEMRLIGEQLGRQEQQLTDHGHLLAETLRRLPAQPDADG